ncbi:OPT oligopeptide transporter protein-domain-containing protein [Chytriomyces sp. MP71]|nr:OPT oligopeptide transporter protein-domain-containing protein [Chytriomyces sp. MP71]
MTQADFEQPHSKPLDKAEEPQFVSAEKLEQLNEVADEDYIDEIYEIIDAVVPRTDDPSLPALTFRVWALGLIFGCLICAANTVFTFRTNYYQVTPFVTVLMAYPCGIFMANVLPAGILNPGKFNYKEHALIYVITSSMASTPYALYNIIGQKYQLYQSDLSLVWCMAFAIVTQAFGYGFAGLTRRYLVRPAAMLWPANLATIAMLNSLHSNEDSSNGRYPMSRFKFFWLVTSAIFFYTWLPQFVMPMLGAVSVICFFTRNKANNVTSLVFGSTQTFGGMGLLSFSFDWTMFNSIFFPITTPLWAIWNQFVGSWIFMWIIVPICFFTDAFGMDSKLGTNVGVATGPSPYGFDLNSPDLYNLNGTYLDKKKFVKKDPSDPKNLVLNQAFYDANKPIYITSFFAITYTTSFIVFVAAIVHVALWYGKDIWHRFRATIADLDKEDIHCQLMDVYPEVPDWWYFTLLVVFTALGIATCEVGGFNLPWWGTIIAIILALVSIIPIGTIQAISGQQIGLNVMSEFLIGLILPGRIAAVMAFKTFSYMAMVQGLSLVADLKLGHYIKIAPKAMFAAQLVSTILGAVVSTGVACGLYESFGQVPPPASKAAQYPWGWMWKIQTLDPASGWSSANYNVFLSAGAIWGAIGPARFFGPDSPYFKTLLGFVFGIILPVIPWLLHKAQPDSFWHLVNIPVLVVMPCQAGSIQSILITPLIVSLIVNYYVKKYRHTWWKKYAYVMSAALDSGSAVATLIIFFMAKYGTTGFPYWYMNPTDQERCITDALNDCNGHGYMGSLYGYSYDPTQDPDCNS